MARICPYGNHKQQADRLVNANRIKSLKTRSSEQRNRYVLTRNVTDKESQKDRRTQKLRSHGTNPMKPKSPKHDQSTSTDIPSACNSYLSILERFQTAQTQTIIDDTTKSPKLKLSRTKTAHLNESPIDDCQVQTKMILR